METLYDILGVVPSADKLDCGRAFKSKMLALLGDEFEFRSNLWQQQHIDKMTALIEAIRIVGHGDRKAVYDKKLLAAGVICPVCEGHGFNILRFIQQRGCIACGGTGKAKRYVETDGVDHVR